MPHLLSPSFFCFRGPGASGSPKTTASCRAWRGEHLRRAQDTWFSPWQADHSLTVPERALSDPQHPRWERGKPSPTRELLGHKACSFDTCPDKASGVLSCGAAAFLKGPSPRRSLRRTVAEADHGTSCQGLSQECVGVCLLGVLGLEPVSAMPSRRAVPPPAAPTPATLPSGALNGSGQ